MANREVAGDGVGGGQKAAGRLRQIGRQVRSLGRTYQEVVGDGVEHGGGRRRNAGQLREREREREREKERVSERERERERPAGL
jgi:hypothetical protein